ncbi:MAG: DUF1192 domain-containing protein [Alphaproteobacteria bacterium]|nr:DUF1192 domain-containing protein [Alphaproteobacteria bacterium]
MSEDPEDVRRGPDQALIDLTRQDLEGHAEADLEARIVLLQAEIDRARAQLARKRVGRSAAEALFARKDGPD